MSLVQTLPPGPIDIVGDIHGALDALEALLQHLGYNTLGEHPDGRYLVFVGDLCDRGPDSPAVLSLIQRFVESGRAMAVLGNHEINLMRNDPKDGAGWFFPERYERDKQKYAPFESASGESKSELVKFLNTLPIALEREDIRVIHAAWLDEKIEKIRQTKLGTVVPAFAEWEKSSRSFGERFAPMMEQEKAGWQHDLEEFSFMPPHFPAHAEHAAAIQMENPIKALTSGVEKAGDAPFYAGGKWRFSGRVRWWDHYSSDVPVVIGHYWRKFNPTVPSQASDLDAHLFADCAPESWHGARKNVFCVDYSIGAKFALRKDASADVSNCRLAALRWPEKTLHFDDGEVVATSNFQAS